ncbi:MAG: transaldolase [Bryobacterales bacterium]|nr:transaldolase [Bryobacterales bacterium]
MNPIEELRRRGQSLWLDYISRGMIRSGELKRLIEQSGITGLTSNPTLFERAIDDSNDYHDALESLAAAHLDARSIYEALSVEDVRNTCDLLKPVYEATGGADGFASIEVSPFLAHDSKGSVAEASRLWREISRPNLMVKIPATEEGIPAIADALAEGININVTLIFSMRQYEAVADAFLRGIERAANPAGLASVASVFVSRIDTAVDRELENIGTPDALALRGRAAIANARLIYRRFREICSSPRFAALHARRIRPQRVLWGSTGTKNKAYPDLMYVEELVAPETINTVPPATLHALQDHGRIRGVTASEGWAEAESVLRRIRSVGVDFDALLDRLEADGVAAFGRSLDKLLERIDHKRSVAAH